METTPKEIVAYFIKQIQEDAAALDPETMPFYLEKLAHAQSVMHILRAVGTPPPIAK